jgi:hypothetical protein
MAGCNCKRGKGTLNNVNNPDYIQIAQEVFNRVISGKEIQDLNDLDKVEIMGVYSSLYPNSSGTPSIESAIEHIKVGIEMFNTKYGRRK